MPNAAVTGWGMALPDRVLSNADLEQLVHTSDDWIVSRTGIRERRLVSPGESTADLALTASRRALTSAGLAADELDLVIVATVTPDTFMPSTASLVQHRLGAIRAGAFDLGAACSGFVYAFNVAAQFIQAGTYRNILVVGADTLTRMLDFTDRSTCILFGDGAGAVVLQATDEPHGVLSTVLGSDGRGAEYLYVDGWQGVSNEPSSAWPGRPYMKMNGREVYRFSVEIIGDVSSQAIERAGLTYEDIDLLIPHQANTRILDAAAKRLSLPREKIWSNLDRFGNTSAASVPICIAEAADGGHLRPGMHVVLIAFGSGVSWAASVVRWGSKPGCPRTSVPETSTD